ncbi:uncharacterized protein [Dermacentor andersoni]|uniref:uncharacterized protein isoform X2 n=1 Tax=Dermacentor andersoni TaxID=34620 RepID=UPI003B3A6116
MSDVRLRSCASRRQSLGVEMLARSNPRNRNLHKVPHLCTQTPTRPCDTLACLHILNEWLVAIGVEVKEVSSREIAIADRKILLRAGNFSDNDVLGATLALYLLLCEHQCVSAVDMKVLLNLPPSVLPRSIFWSSLRKASWVTCLELVKCVPRGACISSLINTISCLLERRLIQLTLQDIYLEGTTEHMRHVLVEAFAATSNLKKLSISHVGYCTKSQGLSEEDVRIDHAILNSIADNANLTSFTFAFCYPQSACVASIRRLLENTTTLTNLTITHWALHDRAYSVKQIIAAVAANRTLTSLTLRDLNLNPVAREKLAQLLNSNGTLQYVAFLTRKTSSEEASTSQALEKTKSLKQVVLNWSFSLEEIRHLAQAIHSKMLELHLPKISLAKPEPFLSILDCVPGSRKVVFKECTFPEGPLPPMILTSQEVKAEQPLCSYTVYDISLNSLYRVVAGVGRDHIRSLELRARANLGPDMRHDLASYLASTRRLRRLHLEIKNDPQLLTAVFHGLSQNNSIEDLLIHADCNIDEKSVELFSGWLSTNPRLHSLEVSYSCHGKERLAEALAKSMHRNYALMFIALGAADRPYYEHLCNLTWRNLGLLHCAAGYVLGCTEMRAAKAYGLLARHPLLLETVQKSGPLSSNELKEKFRKAELHRRLKRQSPCDAFAFTYCHSPRNEFFYKRSINACVAVATDMVGLCIGGRNRFTSKKSCRQACVDGRGRTDRCLNNAVFRRCETQDVTGQWWHFDGHSCLKWNLPSGMCPSYNSDVFSSQRDCWTNCVAKPRKRLCRVATPDVCYSAHLRFPYFVVGGPEARCLKVSSISYGGRRCLAGSNRFQTVQACQEACMSNTHFD